MTTSRIVRGTKIRIFLSFCAIVVILGLLACYNNTLTQLDETQKAVGVCHQQQENLSTQLQVISDYKLRLEKALKTEKAEHSKSNATFVESVKDERIKSEKTSKDAQLRFNSLQQKYNLLQIEYDDFKEKSSKNKEEQHAILEDLQNRLKDLEENISDLKKSKENLKSEVANLLLENGKFKMQLEDHESNIMGSENKTNFLQKQNIELRMEIEGLKDKCSNHDETHDKPVIIHKTPQKLDEQAPNQNVLVMPNMDVNNGVKSSSTSSSSKQNVSKGSLNGARPLAVPTLTPKQKKIEVPEGVLPIPNGFPDNPAVPAEEKLQSQNEIIDNRYKNQMDDEKNKKLEVIEKENNANENFGNDGLEFGDPIKQAEKRNFGKKHIDNLRVFKEENNPAGGDYRINDQMEDNAGMDENEDDDQDEYGDHLARRKEVAVRN